jgi:hypothetical protein
LRSVGLRCLVSILVNLHASAAASRGQIAVFGALKLKF